MTMLTLDLPAELVARLEEVAGQTGQPLNALVADALAACFAPSAPAVPPDAMAGGRIQFRPVRLVGWPAGSTFRREEIYGDDAR